MKQALFIDRDGTILKEPEDEQIDSYDKFEFLPGVIRNLNFLRTKLDFEFVMVSNQDGLGTDSYPEDTFWPTHNLMLDVLKGEGVEFDDILIDRSFPSDNLPTRKPGTGMLGRYLSGDYDMSKCFVIGDRATDAQLAKNMGCRAIIINPQLRGDFADDSDVYVADTWGECSVSTGLGFFDHMLEQIAKHGGIDLKINVKGDLNVDEHHTIEDTGLALGECIAKALGDKRGIERYGYCLPMDDSLCHVVLDFGGRPWLVWNAEFKREKVGDVPTEMFMHFFKSFSDAAKMNLNIWAEGENEHHKIEGIFKALARSLKMAIKRDIYKFQLPSSKGVL